MDAQANRAVSPPQAAGISMHARYTVAFLFVLYSLNHLDRHLLAILMEPIRRELLLSDTQLGVLSGLAFALFYATLGIPIARLADFYSRRNIIAAAVAVWSLMTALCGMASGFISLLIARIGVGVGEAGGSPPAHSMISDYYPPSRRGAALAIYSAGAPVGILLGLAGGGWLNHVIGWRMAFLLIGVPGILLALLFFFTVREPKRGALDGDAAEEQTGGMAAALRHIWNLKTFRWITFGSAVHAICAYGVVQWYPSYIIRVFGLSTNEVGLTLGLLIGTTGFIGTLAGGYLSDFLGKRDPRWYQFVPALAIGICIPFYAISFHAPSVVLALTFFLVPMTLANVFTGPSFATIQSISPVHSRAIACSFYLFILNLIGLGAGPSLVGVASDMLQPAYGNDALRWALSLLIVAEFVAVYCFIRAARSMAAEYRG
ncbi:MAG: MFS transporter [Alphaproteobacteria bacterium]|nr:MFS transporter [Alphaproteobacteria bacterium]